MSAPASVDLDLVSGLARSLPDDVVGVCGGIVDLQGPLHPIEQDAVSDAGPRRQAEFRAGRSAARRALAALGCAAPIIARADDRQPVWPSGFTGSISHSRTLCAAIVARNTSHAGLGLDLESREDLDPDLVEEVSRRVELRAAEIVVLAPTTRVHRPKLLFVIKEAVFKAYYPLTGYFLDFQEVTVELHPPTRSFIARLDDRCPAIAGGRAITGRFDVLSDHLVALVCLEGCVGPRPGSWRSAQPTQHSPDALP